MEISVLILVVENEVLIGIDVENSLEEGGFKTHLAHNGKEAIARCCQSNRNSSPIVGALALSASA